jgi:hypothetical protein
MQARHKWLAGAHNRLATHEIRRKMLIEFINANAKGPK